MSLFSGDNELGNILQEAVKLKSAQMGEKRKTYEKWPYFVQHTLFHGEKDDYKAGRQLPFNEKLRLAEKVKEAGNELYAQGSYSDAVDKYEEAPTVFYYCYSTDPGWRKNNRGIDDDVIVLVDDQGTTEEEASQQKKLRLACCLNLAACKQKMEKYDEVIVACDTALELDPTNVKALYRRAEARVKPSKSTAYDHDLAIKDLAKAHQQDPKNQIVEKLLTKLRGERKVQRGKDQKTFTGLFDRGTIYKPEDLEGTPVPASAKNDVDISTIQARIDGISDEDTLEKRTADAELLRDLYMRNGKEDEAKELNAKIDAAKKALREQTNPTEARTGMDWDNPTPEMIEDAKKYNLDLTDPLVISELKKLEREGVNSLPPEGEEEAEVQFPPPEMMKGPPIPWMRYVWLFFGIFSVWRLIDTGVVVWLVVMFWRHVLLRIVSIFGVGRANDFDGEEEERISIFAIAYRQLFGSDVDAGL